MKYFVLFLSCFLFLFSGCELNSTVDNNPTESPTPLVEVTEEPTESTTNPEAVQRVAEVIDSVGFGHILPDYSNSTGAVPVPILTLEQYIQVVNLFGSSLGGIDFLIYANAYDLNKDGTYELFYNFGSNNLDFLYFSGNDLISLWLEPQFGSSSSRYDIYYSPETNQIITKEVSSATSLSGSLFYNIYDFEDNKFVLTSSLFRFGHSDHILVDESGTYIEDIYGNYQISPEFVEDYNRFFANGGLVFTVVDWRADYDLIEDYMDDYDRFQVDGGEILDFTEWQTKYEYIEGQLLSKSHSFPSIIQHSSTFEFVQKLLDECVNTSGIEIKLSEELVIDMGTFDKATGNLLNGTKIFPDGFKTRQNVKRYDGNFSVQTGQCLNGSAILFSGDRWEGVFEITGSLLDGKMIAENGDTVEGYRRESWTGDTFFLPDRISFPTGNAVEGRFEPNSTTLLDGRITRSDGSIEIITDQLELLSDVKKYLLTNTLSRTVVNTAEQDVAFIIADFACIASIPEYDIYLYNINDGLDMLLYYDGKYEILPYYWQLPRLYLPELTLYDHNEDGKLELVIKIYQQGGTGVSMWSLLLVEIDEDNESLYYEGIFYKFNHKFLSFEVLSQLILGHIEYVETVDSFWNFYINNIKYSIDLEYIISSNYPEAEITILEFGRPYLLDINYIYFEEKILVKLDLQANYTNNLGMPLYFGDGANTPGYAVYASLIYEDGRLHIDEVWVQLGDELAIIK